MTRTLLAALLLAMSATPLVAAAQATATGTTAEPAVTLPAELPKNGQKMEAVRARYGEPVSIDPAVGDPPITRWIYAGFTVYFEYDLVLHTVVDK